MKNMLQRKHFCFIIPAANMIRNLMQHKSLIFRFIHRNVLLRYRGSYLGSCWSLLRPLALLGIYAVVFGQIFESKMGVDPDESAFDFTLALFCGILLFQFFGECAGSAPLLIVTNVNYVKKVVFPLEILPIATVGAALIHMIVGFVPLFIALIWVDGGVPVTAFYFPVIVMPLVFLSMGICWLLSSMGVFVRDLNTVAPLLITILMFGSAIFYSLKSIPQSLLPYFQLNPIASIIDQARNAVLWGVSPSWPEYGVILFGSLFVMIFGYYFFMRTKKGFADVL
jgi:lipopolysaccharide transport system permease protein